MPQKFQSGKSSYTLSISGEMTVNIPQYVMENSSLAVGQQYDLEWITGPPVTILLKANDRGDYTMSYQGESAGGYIGGKMTLRKFCKEIIEPRQIKLPIRKIRPAFLCKYGYDLAVVVQPFVWQTHNLTEADFAHLNGTSDPDYGVYQYLDASGRVLKIGEGVLRNRLREHIRMNWHDVVSARFFTLHHPNREIAKSDGQLFEQLLLSWFVDDNGDLPAYNKIHR